MSKASARPTIVCLCGSTRFYEAFQEANYQETMAGKIVLSVGFYLHRPDVAHREDLGCTPEQKVALDELHKRKIELSDEVLVLNVGGYVGESTRSEIEHAEKIGRPLRYLEPCEACHAEHGPHENCALPYCAAGCGSFHYPGSSFCWDCMPDGLKGEDG